MHRFRLSLADLADASFACSPLQEAALSLRMWKHPGVYVQQTAWFERLRPRFEELDTEFLCSLVATTNRYIPDFLTPRPATAFPSFASELELVRALPPEQLAGELERTFLPHDQELPPRLAAGLADPARLLGEIADALAEYWEHCLAPAWWPRARPVLHADIVHRSKILAERGSAALFADLDHRLSWDDGVLTIDRDWTPEDEEIPVARRGLVFTPTFFCRGAITTISYHSPPIVTYPVRGQGAMASTPQLPPTPQALTQLLGAPKARLLTLLAEPASTTQLAGHLGVSPGAVSQHLGVLHATRLVTRVRHGRVVLYARSPLADELCG
ncbi:MarR family transcriptional regulator [Kitasatospora sp. MMS16-BH015]|uniref:ArsR/SmtB family transcription factor n=1 Tax=Kitasatospora sp. MMS16-BH015 TaxID=2018025 RepID=UPI000CA146B0|nr:helix-turn-helix domain-containing protein [Kitasatospora sp. MMS16-BH015]AUG81320.1 MarR family transcriptional regulator [Kitasatospora sp. MMS16-BH015]